MKAKNHETRDAWWMAVVSGISGAIFGVGLWLSAMIDPARVRGFLDIAGEWDPTLAFVMGFALLVYTPSYAWIRKRREAPLLTRYFALPTRKDIDAPLVVGSVLFGIGWALGGFCPGPGLVSAGAGTPDAFVFVSAMIVGMALFKIVGPRLVERMTRS